MLPHLRRVPGTQVSPPPLLIVVTSIETQLLSSYLLFPSPWKGSAAVQGPLLCHAPPTAHTQSWMEKNPALLVGVSDSPRVIYHNVMSSTGKWNNLEKDYLKGCL